MLLRALVLAVMILVIAPLITHAQTPTLDYQRGAILVLLARYGVIPGQVYTVGNETYTIKDVTVTFDRHQAPTIVIRNERQK